MEKELLKKYIPIQLKRARQLGIPVRSITISPRKNKKYRIELINGAVIDYGNPAYEDYLMHQDPERRKRFQSRWANNPRINDPYSPVFYITRLNW